MFTSFVGSLGFDKSNLSIQTTIRLFALDFMRDSSTRAAPPSIITHRNRRNYQTGWRDVCSSSNFYFFHGLVGF